MEKTEEVKRYLKYQTKIRVLKIAEELGCKYACEAFGISKTTFFNWKRRFDHNGEEGLLRKNRDSKSYGNCIDANTVQLILKLRDESWAHGGLKWYLERYHDIEISESSVFRTLKRHNVKPLDRTITRKTMGPKRYSKKNQDTKCKLM